MSSNRLYNLFQSLHLHRRDIDSYGTTKDAAMKNNIEQKAASNDFDTDAFEGWETQNFNSNLMHNLDAKFIQKPKTNYIKGISLTLIGAIVISLLFVYNLNHSSKLSDKPTKNTEVASTLMVDETDIILRPEIEEMIEAPTKEQIKPKKIKSDFADMKTFEEERQTVKEVGELPVKEVKSAKEIEIVSTKKNAKEIYLNDLKLIDYNKYRTDPVIKTKQVLLTGTPANLESEQSEEIEATWRTVDVPYNEYMDKSLRVLNSGNYKKALSRFEIILKTYPEDLNAYFYSGYCLYNLGEYDFAIEHFQKCLIGNFSNFDEEAEWMTAQAYLLNGNKNQANTIFKSIVSKNGYYAKQAKGKISQ